MGVNLTNIYSLEKRIALLEQKLFLEKDALNLQKDEYARRLNELNHAHKIAEDNWQKTLPRESFDIWKDEFNKWKADVALKTSGFITRDFFETWKKENEKWKDTVAPVRDVDVIFKSVEDLKVILNRAQGIIMFLQFAGAAGIIGLLIGILRMTGVIK